MTPDEIKLARSLALPEDQLADTNHRAPATAFSLGKALDEIEKLQKQVASMQMRDNLYGAMQDKAYGWQDIARGHEKEIKRLRTFIEGVREFDPRSDHYANELHGDACEVLGLCRCCGEKVCLEND